MNNDIFADIERAIETKQSVTRSFNIGGKRCQETTSEVIDIEPVSTSWSPAQSPYASGSRFVSGNFRHTPPALGHIDRVNSVGRHTSTVSPGIAKEVLSAMAKIDGSGLPSDMCSPDKASIFRTLIEFEFSILSEGEKMEVVRMLGYDVTNTWPRSGNWNVVNGQKFESIIKLACMLIIRGRNEAAVVIGNLLGLKPEYCFRTFPQKDDIPSVLPFRNPQVEDLIPKQLVVLDRTYELTLVHYLRDFRGIKESAVCVYVDSANPQNRFSLPATRIEKDGKLTLRIGRVPVPARLFARDQMAQVEGATVLFCQDTRIAMELSRIADEARLLENYGIIISGCYGGAPAFAVLKFNDFAGQNVVLLLESTREALIDAPKWAERCEKAGATSVRIYPWPLIPCGGLVGEDLDGVESSGQDQWKDMLLMQAEHLDDIALPSKFARAICNRALSLSDYKRFIIDIGVVTAPLESSKESTGRSEAEEVSFISLGEISEENSEDDGPLTLEQLINPENSSVTWGATGTSKSWVADEFAIGIATGTEAFGIPAHRARVVCIMDGEISPQKRKQHIMQLLQRRLGLVALADKNIHIRRPMSGFRRFDEAYADILIPKLKLLSAELFIIDNLQALDPKAGKYSSDNLNQFIQKLEFNGIAVFIVHHSDKDGTTYKGPTDLTDLAQNVFRVDGRKQLRLLEDKSERVKEACKEGGPVIRLTVEKTKICGLDDCSVIYHLPMYGAWEWIEGELSSAFRTLPESNSGESTADETDSPLVDDVKVIDLSPDEEKVRVALKGRKCMRAELETVTGFKTDKLGGILRGLVARGFVTKAGVGKATYYTCG